MQVTFAFELNQEVVINATSRSGKVVGQFIDRDEIKSAYVQYFTEDGRKNHDYFRENEIKLATAPTAK